MLPIDDIIQTALREHEGPITINESEALIQRIRTKSSEPSTVPYYSHSSPQLSVVKFRCLLQDTGYPAEVYLPGETEDGADVDWSKLKERWVGWGVEVPGEQAWTRDFDLSSDVEGLSLGSTSEQGKLPKGVHGKFPLPGKSGDYLGALIKVYDEVSYKPASVHTFIGILSTSPLPAPLSQSEEDSIIVPTIHVLSILDTEEPIDPTDESVREELISYLSTAFSPPDKTAAEYLILLLISSPTSRPTSLQPLGTISINFLKPSSIPLPTFLPVISSLTPNLVPLPLTIPLLHSHPFLPSSTDSSSLSAGLLQLAPGTVMIVEEDGMGDGGQLNEKALKNLKAMSEVLNEQMVRYEYPYMDGLKMESSIRMAVISEGKSLLPVDIHLPLSPSSPTSPAKPSTTQLTSFRNYLKSHSSLTHHKKFQIPEKMGTIIQESFVNDRKSNTNPGMTGKSSQAGIEVAEERLKRRMKIARLLAVSFDNPELTGDIWEKCVELDKEIEERLIKREEMRRESKFGKPGIVD